MATICAKLPWVYNILLIESQKSKIVQTTFAQISWSYNILILDKLKGEEMRVWYINQTFANGWSYDVLVLIKQGFNKI